MKLYEVAICIGVHFYTYLPYVHGIHQNKHQIKHIHTYNQSQNMKGSNPIYYCRSTCCYKKYDWTIVASFFPKKLEPTATSQGIEIMGNTYMQYYLHHIMITIFIHLHGMGKMGNQEVLEAFF